MDTGNQMKIAVMMRRKKKKKGEAGEGIMRRSHSCLVEYWIDVH